MKFCTQCGQSAPDDHRFCTKCGAPFGAMPATGTPVPPPSVVFTPAPPPGEKTKSNRNLILLIVAAVALVIVMPVLIMVAVAYPALVRARSAANESAAVHKIHAINTALGLYRQRYKHYPLTLDKLTSPLAGAPDENHAALAVQPAWAARSGYAFTYQATRSSDTADLDHYELHADPIKPGRSGVHHFFSDESGVIRWDQNPATASSPKLNY